jgi:hypothetical protein
MNRLTLRRSGSTNTTPTGDRKKQEKPLLPSFRWLLVLTSTLVLLLALPTPSLAVAPGVNMEYDLGKPCYETRSERPSREESNKLNAKLDEAIKTENWTRAAELQKERVRYWCWDARRWLDLAKYFHRADNDTESLKILTELYEKEPNWFDQLLRSGRRPFLREILNDSSYEHSSLKNLREQETREWQKRRKNFREKLSNLPADEKPSNPYVARDVCPFECCTYRTWSVQGSTPLFDKPESDTQIAHLDEGDTVEALTGNVYLQPKPVGVVHDLKLDRETTVPAGEIVFILDYMGEGYSRIFYRGKTYSTSTYFLRSRCPRPNGRCWGEFLTHDTARHDWWVKLRTPEGLTAWTNRLNLFGNMDACG